MASMSGRHASGASGVGVSSAPAEPRMWSYSVPMDDENVDPAYADENYGSYDGRQQSPPYSNTSSKPKLRSKSSNPSAQQSANGLSNRYSADQSNTDEAYNDGTQESGRSQSASRSRATSTERLKVKKKTSKGAVAAITEEEDKWIHRDKLMQIESRELKEMTMRYSKGSRAASRAGKSTKASVASVDLDAEDAQDAQPTTPGYDRRGHVSEYNDVDEEPDDNSPAGPDELMGEELIENSEPHSQSHSRRPSVSRIPVSKSSSGVGSPEQDQPSSPPSRTANGLVKARTRSNSQRGQSSQDATPSQRGPSGAASPQSSAVGSPRESQNTNASGARKGSATKKTSPSAQRPGSKDSPSKRPTTRDGNSRPPTAKVEEDPPWMSSMYKPDPRLPPDQQMLPTHAKRLAKEREEAARREKENRPPMDEADYQLMPSDESPNEDGASPRMNNRGSFPSPNQAEPDLSDHPAYRNDPDRSQWPLRTQDQSLQNAADGGPANAHKEQTTLTQHASTGSGNYNLMPNVRGSREGSSMPTSPQLAQQGQLNEKTATQSQAPTNVARVPETKEEEGKKEKKGGCAGCCVVM